MPFYFFIVGFIDLLKSMTNEMNTAWKYKIKDDLNKNKQVINKNVSQIIRFVNFKSLVEI